jgi:nicotinamidase-related amidase
MQQNNLPIPDFYSPESVGRIWNVPYQQRLIDARNWALKYQIPPSSADKLRTCLLAIDVQNSFCMPGFELFVGGNSGNAAVEDNQRLCQWIYNNLSRITHLCATLDTHHAMQIFHSVFLVNEHGKHPEALTIVSRQDLEENRWKISPQVAENLGMTPEEGQAYLIHYAQQLQAHQKYDLTIWPYHVMLGSVGHALVPAVEEAFFFHNIARYDQVDFQIKGNNPLTEHYSAIGPEVIKNQKGQTIDQKSQHILKLVQDYDRVIIAGQAKSHCVAWTINDLLQQLLAVDETLVSKVYLLEDCTSPVVIPGVVDYTHDAEAAFEKFSAMGMHRVRTTQPLEEWPGFIL